MTTDCLSTEEDEFDNMDWLFAIGDHYGTDATPFDVACEMLLGRTDPEEAARAIARRGRKVGNGLMARTTPKDVADAVEELLEVGFLESVFEAPSSAEGMPDGTTEHVLELRMPHLGEGLGNGS